MNKIYEEEHCKINKYTGCISFLNYCLCRHSEHKWYGVTKSYHHVTIPFKTQQMHI